jgi:hypothetical protein
MAGILSPASGRVAVAGFALPGNAVQVKERIGYVPEAAGFFETLSGQEFLELCGRLHGIHEDTLQARIRENLERFDLSTARLRRLDGYSKGMRQKILLAAALIHNPQLILISYRRLLLPLLFLVLESLRFVGESLRAGAIANLIPVVMLLAGWLAYTAVRKRRELPAIERESRSPASYRVTSCRIYGVHLHHFGRPS